MRITEGQLRLIIREELLNEAPPLIDMPSFDNPRSEKNVPSIGHPRSRSKSPRYRAGGYDRIARELMRDTPDDWVIVVFNDSWYSESAIKSPAFKKWIEDKNYPPGTIIVVVGSSSLPGDYRTPAWQIAHDIFGHAIDNYWARTAKHVLYAVDDLVRPISDIIHRILPAEMRLSKIADDMQPDIFGAIFLRKITKEEALTAVADGLPAEFSERAQKIVESMFDVVDDWTEVQRSKSGTAVLYSF